MKDGGPAFPRTVPKGEWPPDEALRILQGHAGMSLRDYFAGQALSQVIAAYLAANGNGCAADHALRNVPALAYKYADAMLAERAKE